MHPYLVFGTVGLGLFMASIDISMVAVAFPHLVRDLGTNLPWAAWTMSIYQLSMTIVMPLAGRLCDSLGHRRIFLFSMSLFTVSSVLCGLAPNIYGLIIFRFFQGIGAGSFLPTAAGIVSGLFPERRESSIGLLTSIFPIGGIVGPNLGGWIVDQYSWRYVFYINIPIGIVLLALSHFYLDPSPHPYAPPRMDLRGATLFIGGILFLMLGLNGIAEHTSLPSFLRATAFLLLSIGFIVFFLRFENGVSHPLLDLSLLKSRPFLAANLYNLIQGSTFLGVFSFIPLYSMSVYDLSTFGSGMILTPRSIGVIAASAITSFRLKKWGYRWPMLLGLGVVSFITVVLGQGPQLWGDLGREAGKTNLLAFLILISGVGVGVSMPASNNACIELMPDKVSTITGLRGMFRSVGGIFGVSVITMILHLSSTPALGFKIAFTCFGLWICTTVPLVFLMPDGREAIRRQSSMQPAE